MQAKGNKKLAALGKATNVFASNIDIMNAMPHESQRMVDWTPVDNTDALSAEENKERVAEARALLIEKRNYEDGK